MWMPPQTTLPPVRTDRRAAGRSAPTGATTMAASSGGGAGRGSRVVTAFTGAVGRDAIAHVAGALTDGRLTVDSSLGGAHAIDNLAGFHLFRFACLDRAPEATIVPGHVCPDFIALGAKPGHTAQEEARLTE
jgi:hypothetical protein